MTTKYIIYGNEVPVSFEIVGDMILIADEMLGHETTICVSLNDFKILARTILGETE